MSAPGCSTEAPTQPPAVPDLLFPGAATKVYTADDQRTGADGQAGLEFIPGSPPAGISVGPPPGTKVPMVTAFPAQSTGLTIRLHDGPGLHGRIVTPYGDPFYFSDEDSCLEDMGGNCYLIGGTGDGYAVGAPPGQYRVTFGVGHDEEGESSDYTAWEVRSQPFELAGDRTLDLTIPFGYARLMGVDEHGDPVTVETPYETVSGPWTIADGIDAHATTYPEPAGYTSAGLPVIGPSISSETYVDSTFLPGGVYLAPGEDTIIALTPGVSTGSGDDDPASTTPTTTQPPTTTTTGGSGTATSHDPPSGVSSHQPATTPAGYWALGFDGHVYNFGEAPALGNSPAGAVDLESTPSGKGYWTLNRNGVVHAFGDAATLGGVDLSKLAKGEEPASLSATPSGNGYWVFTNRGRVLAFGDAPFLGDMSQTKLNGPVLGSVATPSGRGYYMVASDGGIFAFGDAAYAGSMGGKKLNAPVTSLVPDADRHGYWLVASDGGIFAFDAPFRGSMGGTKLNKAVVGMVRYGDGYLMVGADGGIFNFSILPFAGSLGDTPPTAPVVAVAALPDRSSER